LRELIQNSKKFHPDHDPNVEIVIEPTDDGRIRLTVSDNGISLSPAQLRNVWKPYYQVDKDQSGRIPGMGLGLSMVASLVWGVGGTCKLYNRESRNGVVVDIRVPRESVEEKKAPSRRKKALI
jgi:two-component system, cell cycle response regulator